MHAFLKIFIAVLVFAVIVGLATATAAAGNGRRPQQPSTKPKQGQAPDTGQVTSSGRDIEPDEVAHLRAHVAAFGTTGDWSHLLVIGDAYKNGSYPRFLPDQSTALRCYALAARCRNAEVSSLARARYAECTSDTGAPEDRSSTASAMDRSHAATACETAEALLLMGELGNDAGNQLTTHGQDDPDFAWMRFGSGPARRRCSSSSSGQGPGRALAPGQGQGMGEGLGQGNLGHGLATHRDLYAENLFQTGPLFQPDSRYTTATGDTRVIAQTIVTQVGQKHHRSDAQNAHDHGVCASVKRNIDAMRQQHDNAIGDPVDDSDYHERMMDQILSCQDAEVSAEAKTAAIMTLDSLNDNQHSRYGVSERELLALVMQSIAAAPDGALRANATESLVKQLAGGVERGHVVCSTGKMSRMVGALEGTGLLCAEAKPMWAVREELGSLAAKVRDECGDNDQAAAKAFAAKARATYVQGLGMSEAVLAPLIEEYKQGF